VRTRTLRAGSGLSAYTLLEMVVVLAIAGVVIGVAVPVYSKLESRIRIFKATQTLLVDLRQARNEAATEHKIVTITFSSDEDHYRFDNRDHWLPVHIVISLENGIGWLPKQPHILHFYADGSANPVAVTLVSGERQTKFHIDWLTGHMRSDDNT
jgi:general secretion pathway protein H